MMESLLRAFVASQLYDQLSIMVTAEQEKEWVAKLSEIATEIMALDLTSEGDTLIDRRSKDIVEPSGQRYGLERAMVILCLSRMERIAPAETAAKIRQMAVDAMEEMVSQMEAKT